LEQRRAGLFSAQHRQLFRIPDAHPEPLALGGNCAFGTQCSALMLYASWVAQIHTNPFFCVKNDAGLKNNKLKNSDLNFLKKFFKKSHTIFCFKKTTCLVLWCFSRKQ